MTEKENFRVGEISKVMIVDEVRNGKFITTYFKGPGQSWKISFCDEAVEVDRQGSEVLNQIVSKSKI